MKKHIYFPAAVLLLLAGLNAAAQVQVVSKTPYGPIADMNAARAIAATFSQPMAALSSAEKMGEVCPLEVFRVHDELTGGNYPSFSTAVLADFKDARPVKGRCRWQGTQTVAFEPEEALAPASLYAARVRAFAFGGGALREDAEWFFETLRPALTQSVPHNDARWLPLDTIFFAAFNLPMSASRARQFIELSERAPDGSVKTLLAGVRLAKDEEVKKLWPYSWEPVSTGTVVAVRPAAPLKPDHAYTLRLLAGLPAAGGNLGLTETRSLAYEAYYTFRTKRFPNSGCLPHEFTLGFSNPVKYSELQKKMSVEPSTAMPPPWDGARDFDGSRDHYDRTVYHHLPNSMFKSGTPYSFRISPDLTDIFGNKLGAEAAFSLEAMDYCPYWSMPTGFGILEGYLPARHPLNVLNAGALSVLKGRVSDENLVPFMRGRMQNETLLSAREEKSWQAREAEHNVNLLTFMDFRAGALFGPQEGGFAFLRVPGMHGDYRALDNITRVGLTVKSSPDSTLIWTSFLKTGRPAAGVPVEIRGDDNKVLWTGRSDKDGFADAPGWLKLGIADWDRWERPALWVFARHSGGTAVMNTAWNAGVEPWRFYLNYDHYPRPRRYAGALFTERGVYRPGETVDIKAIGRKLSGGDWEQLDFPVAQIAVADSRGNRVLKATVPVSAEFSSFDYAYKLSGAAPTGWWTVEVSEPYEDDPSSARAVEEDEEGEYRQYIGKETPFRFTERFRVEEFKPAVFEVKARSLEPGYLAGGRFKAAVEGWYLFGAPMAGSKTDWTLRLESAHYTPPGWEGYRFGGEYGEGRVDKLAGTGSLELDGKGKAAVEVQLDRSFGGGGNALRALFEAGVTDPERQRLFGRASAWVHRADLYFGIKASGGFVEAGRPWSAEVAAVRPDGAAADGAAGTARMVKRQWLSSRRAGLGGRLEWVSERKDTVVSSFTFSAGGAPVPWTFTPDEGGYYIFTVSGTDEEGRGTESSFSFYVFGGGDAWWAREDTDIVELLPERTDYKPGETARIMVKSPYDEAQALVTVEREGVLDRWLTVTKGGADFISVPIKEKYLPNAYVSVILVRGRAAEQKFTDSGDGDLSKPQAKFGYAALNVSPEGRRLSLSLKSDKADYRPGQEVRLDLQVRDEAGRPAAAELTVFAVDEGVLSLTGYATPDAFREFYGPRPLNILTADSRLHVIGQRNYGEKGEASGGGGGAGLAGIDLRSDFRPTAYWNPAVRAGADGRASVSFKLPDSLTRFRLMAVANADRRFGSGEAAVTVSKPLSLRPSLPRLARAGDTFECGAVLHNYTSSAAVADLELELSGDAVTATGESARRVTVEGGKAGEFTWACSALKPGESVFRFRARAGGETDGLEWRLPVRAWEPREYAAASGAAGNLTEEALLRPYAGAEGDLALTMSATALTGLNEGARYLLEYPYGCLEQKLSRAMPVVTGAELIETFGLGSLGTLKAEVSKVFEKLPDYQHPSGGFCYWTGGCLRPDPYLTAYALEAAALAGKEGYSSDPAVIKRAADWLQTYLGDERTDWAYPYSVSEDYAARAYAVYALALHGRGMGSYFNLLYQKRAQLPYLAKAYMVKAAKLLGFDTLAAKKLTAEIMAQARYSPTQLHFEDAEPMPWIHNSSVKTTAVMLEALLSADGGFAGDEKAVKWLTTEKKNKGRWRNTQENAWALRAFQGFYRRYEADEPDFRAVASLSGAGGLSPLADEWFKGRSLAAPEWRFGFDRVFGSGDQAKVLFSKAGTGRLYYTLRMGFTPQRRDKPASEGLEISRTLKPMDGGKVFKAGARAIVTITVRSPQDRTFVAVSDPVPAGFEIVNTEFAVESAEDARALAGGAGRGGDWGGFQRAERYDDRMLIFADYLTAGEHKYSYVVQATVPGSFYGPAALAEGMYEPEVFGRTAGAAVEIVR